LHYFVLKLKSSKFLFSKSVLPVFVFIDTVKRATFDEFRALESPIRPLYCGIPSLRSRATVASAWNRRNRASNGGFLIAISGGSCLFVSETPVASVTGVAGSQNFINFIIGFIWR
jgi:hypothetical protein